MLVDFVLADWVQSRGWLIKNYKWSIFVEGAGHARSREVAGFEMYTGYIGNFLKNSGII